MESLSHQLYASILKHRNNTAFVFDGINFTYQQLWHRAGQLQPLVIKSGYKSGTIGIIANQDFDTYSAIVAAMLSGITFIPIELTHPDERNNHIIKTAKVNAIFCSESTGLNNGFFEHNKLIIIQRPPEDNETSPLKVLLSDSPAYVLFTSGSTGLPKGVPISMHNLEAFVGNVAGMKLEIEASSKFLQVFDLTFDLSIFSFLIPLLHGACIYSLPKTPLKYTLAVQLMEDQHISHVLTVPSFVSYLKPYFNEIRLPELKKWLFCGEALKSDLVKGWQNCLPNAEIFNVYGPTEATIFCTSFLCRSNSIKDLQGIVSIGKPFTDTLFSLYSDVQTVIEPDTPGELLIGGEQVTTGYLDDPQKNKTAFLSYNNQRFYRSGDICRRDSNGDYFFAGRNDMQVKVQGGYRVELGEIEHHARNCEMVSDATAIAIEDLQGISVIYLFVTPEIQEKEILKAQLSTTIPSYMFPRVILSLKEFPLNVNGKIDKVRLAEYLKI